MHKAPIPGLYCFYAKKHPDYTGAFSGCIYQNSLGFEIGANLYNYVLGLDFFILFNLKIDEILIIMNPKYNRNRNNDQEEEKDKPEVVKFVELNTKKNITIREHFLYLDDVKTAININTLEERRNIKLLIIGMLKKKKDLQAVIHNLEQSAEIDRHRLIKIL